jgi:hypothetical protein
MGCFFPNAFSTAKERLQMPLALARGILNLNYKKTEKTGLEPATSRFGILHSTD